MQWGIDFKDYFDPVHFALPLHPMTELVKRSIEKNGSLDKTEGNKLDFTGLPQNTWQIA